jgi:hypothetical protein
MDGIPTEGVYDDYYHATGGHFTCISSGVEFGLAGAGIILCRIERLYELCYVQSKNMCNNLLRLPCLL